MLYTKLFGKFHRQLLTVDKNVNFGFSMVLFCVVILLKVFNKCHLMFTNAYSRANSPQAFPLHSNYPKHEMNPFPKVHIALWTPSLEHIYIASKNVMQLTLSIFHFQLEFRDSTIPTSFALLPFNSVCLCVCVLFQSDVIYLYETVENGFNSSKFFVSINTNSEKSV